MLNYHKKYLKYKLKYLNLKKIYGGSDYDSDANVEDDNDSDANVEDELDYILEKVLENIDKGDEPYANFKQKGQNNPGENIMYEEDLSYRGEPIVGEPIVVEESNIVDTVQQNRENINVNKDHIEQLFTICKAQQIQLQEVSKTLRELFLIQKKKLLIEWQEDYKQKLKLKQEDYKQKLKLKQKFKNLKTEKPSNK